MTPKALGSRFLYHISTWMEDVSLPLMWDRVVT